MWWSVKVTNAEESVVLKGSVIHAMKGHAGVTVGCGLSNMAIDKANASAFPHPVYLMSFTKTTAIAVRKLKKDGSPWLGTVYAHSYGHIVDRNDDGTLKKMPALMERDFELRPPRVPKADLRGPRADKDTGQGSGHFIPRGALARAVKAGRIGKNVADQLCDVAGSTSDE